MEPNGVGRIEDCEEWNGGDSRRETTNMWTMLEPKWTLVQLRRRNTNVGGQGPPDVNMLLRTSEDKVEDNRCRRKNQRRFKSPHAVKN